MKDANRLWQESPALGEPFVPESLEALPSAVRRYLVHSIAAGTPKYATARICMEGEIKLKGWVPFSAVQTMRMGSGFEWRAKVRAGLTSISGSDSFVDGVGKMSWKLFGLIPVMSGSGPDIDRSARGRLVSESVLFPTVFLGRDVLWFPKGDLGAEVRLGPAEDERLKLSFAPSGALSSLSMLRWGNPDGGPFGLVPFGGVAEEERSFGGLAIPARLRIGWHFGTDRFADGEFFRCRVTQAEFR